MYINHKHRDSLLRHMNPIDYFNRHGDFVAIFADAKDYDVIDTTTAKNKKLDIVYQLIDGTITTDDGQKYTLFEMLTIVKFKEKYKDAMNYVEYKIMKKKIPFIRVGNDFFKEIPKQDSWGNSLIELKKWEKQTLIDDYGKAFLDEIPKFDDFMIRPNNFDHVDFIDNNYNLYSRFPHKPSDAEGEFPKIHKLMCHIFQENVAKGYEYLQMLYQNPEKRGPILVLTSKERNTGKTTFMNLLAIIFGGNFAQIEPTALSGNFNGFYATKNIIGIDETFLDKAHTIERLKALVTQKSIAVNEKHVKEYSVPFYGKVIMCTNRVTDFARIDVEESRFWIIKVNKIDTVDALMEESFKNEVPYLLTFLNSLPAIDWSKSRMGFMAEELDNEYLQAVKEESRSGLYKDLKEYIEALFLENDSLDEFYATTSEIKTKWLLNYNTVTPNYILKVLRDEFNLGNTKLKRYDSFLTGKMSQLARVFHFKRSDFVIDEITDSVTAHGKSDELGANLPF